MEKTGALSSNDLKVLYHLIFEENFKSEYITLNKSQQKLIAGFLNLSVIDIQSSINNLRFAEILNLKRKNGKSVYTLDHIKAKKILLISNGITELRQKLFDRIKEHLCNIAKICEFPEVFSTVYDVENLNEAFFKLNQDIDSILNITQKLRNINKIVYRLYSISNFFSDIVDIDNEIKGIKDSVLVL